MSKSNKRRNTVVKKISKTAKKTLPIVNDSLEKIGNTAKDVAIKTVPIIEKGVSAVYGTMATGLDLGVKGAKIVARDVSKSKKKRNRKTSNTKRRN